MRDLVLFGSGGFAREVLQIALDLNEAGGDWNVLGFLDDREERRGQAIHGLPVLGGLEWLAGRRGVHLSVAIGSTPVRRTIVQRVEAAASVDFATLVHPLAWVGRAVTLGEGSIVCAGTLITTDITIGRHAILNLGCTVGHDAVLEDFVTMAPGVHISGDVQVGQGCDLGTGCAVIQRTRIGAWSIVGAGAVVTRDLPDNITAVGTPAKPIKEHPAGWHTRLTPPA